MPTIISRKKRDLIMFTTTISPDVYRHLKAFAKSHGVPINRVLEIALTEWLDTVEGAEQLTKEKLNKLIDDMENTLINREQIKKELQKTWQWRPIPEPNKTGNEEGK